MLGFFIAFAVKMPVVPLMAGCRMRTPRLRPPVPLTSRDLAENCRLRFAAFLPAAVPDASAEFAPIAMWLGVIGIFYVRGWPSPRPISNV